MSTFIMKTLLLTIFIIMSFFSFLSTTSSVAEAARLPGGTDDWYANTLRVVRRPGHSPPPYPKPAPPERDVMVASYLNNKENDDNLERPKHPPPSYPKPAPPHRDVTSSRADQLSVLASAYIMTTI
ncbi:uncharacterized protein LOC110718758 [Chenopodium quinoa]|uniref:uncharacterized protein LOC110718758 n=1 Tax=Chenopodium quinoa TaxID=63459 RepID=UPI000B796CBF|nr:uncharacterized protein LOC110718758 [Chenopodium quinoa]